MRAFYLLETLTAAAATICDVCVFALNGETCAGAVRAFYLIETLTTAAATTCDVCVFVLNGETCAGAVRAVYHLLLHMVLDYSVSDSSSVKSSHEVPLGACSLSFPEPAKFL